HDVRDFDCASIRGGGIGRGERDIADCAATEAHVSRERGTVHGGTHRRRRGPRTLPDLATRHLVREGKEDAEGQPPPESFVEIAREIGREYRDSLIILHLLQ